MSDAARPGIEPSELAQERKCWDELSHLMDSLSDEQVVRPGYFPDGWSVKDMLGHIGTWMAEAGMVLEQIRFGTYRAEEIDIDPLNARFLEAMRVAHGCSAGAGVGFASSDAAPLGGTARTNPRGGPVGSQIRPGALRRAPAATPGVGG
jgi:hypothetical protein